MPGPLHPFPIPDQHGDSVAIDFIGPLPVDNGYNMIITCNDCLHADLCLVLYKVTTFAKELASLLFANWYCENGLPTEIISDHDKLFLSKFWYVLHKC